MVSGVPATGGVTGGLSGHVNPTVTLNAYRHLLEREHTDYVVGGEDGRPAA